MTKRRSAKFYLRNEKEVMQMLGLNQVPGSGSSWVAREDGENEDVLCQLKSTDAASIRIKRQSIKALEHNAAIEHKLPVFAVQFLQDDDVYLLVRPQDVVRLVDYLDLGYYAQSNQEDFCGLVDASDGDAKSATVKVIKSNREARDAFLADNKNNKSKFERRERKAN